MSQMSFSQREKVIDFSIIVVWFLNVADDDNVSLKNVNIMPKS